MFTRVPVPVVVAGLVAVLTFGCSRTKDMPTSPSATPAALPAYPVNTATTGSASAPATAMAAGGHAQRAISIMDACDPDSFNAAVGAGACARDGGVRFEDFIELLRRHQSVGAWHFTPLQARMDVGDVLLAVNHGGETHTFTEVEEFGGGIVPMLNELSGNTRVAPECSALQKEDFIPAGGSSRETEEEEGVEKYQCCIHPWMRAEVRVGKH
jgi:plastocyanin